MDLVSKIEQDFHKIAPPCRSCGRRPFLFLFFGGCGFVTCNSTECIDRSGQIERGNNSDYGDAFGRALRTWCPIARRSD